MTTCVVIPAYNEAETIGDVVRALREAVHVFVVDDGSSDATAEQAAAAGAEVVPLVKNRGYGSAIDAGLRAALAGGYRYAVTADGDGQHEPGEVLEVARALGKDGSELVVGIRPGPLRFVERLCAWYARAALGIHDPLCGLKGYDLRFYEEYGGFDLRHSVGTELMTYAIRHGARWTQRRVTLRRRSSGDSRFYTGLQGNVRILRAFRALVRVR